MLIMRLTKTNHDFIDYRDDNEFDKIFVGDALSLTSKLNKILNPDKPIDDIWYNATVERLSTSTRSLLNFRRDEDEETYQYKAIVCVINDELEFDLLDD